MELAERLHRGRLAIAIAKQRGLDTADWERHLHELFEKAGREPSLEEGRDPWMLWKWRRDTLPDWRRILQKSVSDGDKRREDYARWMLREILLDPDYQEPKV